ncbi:NYN domain-containing protein [Amycolatopsis taiwanensis]|uniref:NYN domain-containing protein n=1 Tax=Amycolatopsis taiwanensis TaxID=342230 RepID=A0A9W6R470_9PSEU|nr:NYN domain-containing protein [Amycolatopsis taiwanensis]GLY68040.1 hypothetical protein Atai01_46590 [Amycolatopsis taiwanensis]
MRSWCALYVDAGYLLASVATRATGTSLRSGIEVDHERLIEALVAHATSSSGLPVLRVHWYDAARNSVPDQSQGKISLLPRVKVRLGRIGFDGEQKGVDLRIGLDMVAHARNAAIDVIFLVSGDDDLTEAVEEAQAQGVQVMILGVPGKNGDPHGVSRHLQGAADGLDLLAAEALDAVVSPRVGAAGKPALPPSQPQPPVPSPSFFATRRSASEPADHGTPSPVEQTSVRADPALVYSTRTGAAATATSESATAEEDAHIDQVVQRVLETWLRSATIEQREELLTGRPAIPRDIDRALLLDLSGLLGVYDLTDTTRYRLRARFWANVDRSQRAQRITLSARR